MQFPLACRQGICHGVERRADFVELRGRVRQRDTRFKITLSPASGCHAQGFQGAMHEALMADPGRGHGHSERYKDDGNAPSGRTVDRCDSSGMIKAHGNEQAFGTGSNGNEAIDAPNAIRPVQFCRALVGFANKGLQNRSRFAALRARDAWHFSKHGRVAIGNHGN
jgi:hypothetical protein